MLHFFDNLNTAPCSYVELSDRSTFKIIPLFYGENGDIEFKVPDLTGDETSYYWKRKTGEFYEVVDSIVTSNHHSPFYAFRRIHLSDKDDAEWKEVYKGEEEEPMVYHETDSNWEHIHKLIDDAMQKRDRSISIFISPDGNMSVTAYPWPDADELYEQYKKGRITANDFRAKMGLPMVKNPENFMSKE